MSRVGAIARGEGQLVEVVQQWPRGCAHQSSVVRAQSQARDIAQRALDVEGGEQVPLVVERSSAAMSLPDYDRYDMLLDSAWTIRLAQALGAWLGVEVTATMP